MDTNTHLQYISTFCLKLQRTFLCCPNWAEMRVSACPPSSAKSNLLNAPFLIKGFTSSNKLRWALANTVAKTSSISRHAKMELQEFALQLLEKREASYANKIS